MSYDLLIRNGTVVDGTGAPRYQADVAIADGKVVEIGKVTEGAKRTIDAHGLVVAPGFVDPHTHYDAQICWDGAVTPSSWHGVTSVVMGNCGVGIAPCKPATREIAMKDLVNVEGIPFDVLNKGITWDWETFPEFMDAAAARKPSLNLAFIAPLTPFRHYVMGEASMERAANAEETAKIAALIGEAVDKGALGFSSTTLNQHMGFEGKPLACRNASREELAAYCRELRKRGKGAIEIALTRQVGVLEQDQCELLDFLLDQSGRPVTFIALFDRDDIPDAVRNTLRLAAPQIAKGARPQTSPLPLTRECTMENPFAFAAFPSWKRVFADTNPEAQKKVYADPAFRNQFREDLKNPLAFGNWGRIGVYAVKSWHAFYAASSLSYARFDNSTTRLISGISPTETGGLWLTTSLGGSTRMAQVPLKPSAGAGSRLYGGVNLELPRLQRVLLRTCTRKRIPKRQRPQSELRRATTYARTDAGRRTHCAKGRKARCRVGSWPRRRTHVASA